MTDRTILASLADAMIPGHGDVWPPASAVLDLDRFAALLAEFVPTETLRSLRQGLDADQLLSVLDGLDPAAVERLREAVYRAYYTAPAVQQAIRIVAERAPRDSSPHFDESLLDAVRRRNTRPWRS